MVINKFDGTDYKFLSNFYPSLVFWNGILFPSVEHAYVASKSEDLNFWLRVLMIDDPGKVKKIGRKTKLRENWNVIKIPIMLDFVRGKYYYNINNLKTALLTTGDVLLVEGNHWHDNFWGDCSCKTCKHIFGMNMLGKITMHVRKEIKCGTQIEFLPY